MRRFLSAAALVCLASVRAQEPDQEEDVMEVNCEDYVFPHDSFTQNDSEKVFLAVDQARSGPFKDIGLTKYTTVFGVRILAHKSVADEKILHTANILAQAMDNDSDGVVDNEMARKQLMERYAMLVLVADETFTNFLLSPNETEGLPTELKFCPFAIDFEEVTKIVPGGEPEAVCPDHLFEKDRTLAFVTDHLVGRSWPYHLTDDIDALEESPKYKSLKEFYAKAIADKNFDVEKTGCPEEDLENCGMVMFTSWATSSMLGVDKCYCEAVDAWKLCNQAVVKETYPELVTFLQTNVMKNLPSGSYTPTNTEVLVVENVDHSEL